MSNAGGAVPTAAELAPRLGAEGVLLYAVDGQDLSIVDMWPAHPSASSLRLQVGFGVTGLVARTRKPVLLDSDSPRNALHRRLLRLEPQQTVARMCLPLPGLEGDVVGVLAVHRGPRNPFGQQDLDAAQQYAAVLGLWLHAQRLFRTVNRQRSERDRLVEQAITAQEAERRRIAFDLHDGVTTALASMSFHLSAADLTVSELRHGDRRPTRPASRARAGARRTGERRELADLAYNQTRAAISGLHSLVLDDLGLVAAMESLVRRQRAATGVRRSSCSSIPPPRWTTSPTTPPRRCTGSRRKRSPTPSNTPRPTAVVLSLRRVGDSIVLGCADDGKGFDPRNAAPPAPATPTAHNTSASARSPSAAP